MTDVASLARQHGFQTIHADAVDEIHKAAKGVVRRMVNNAAKVASVSKAKKIKQVHLDVVENIQTGGRTVLPAAYFEGKETEAYFPKEAVKPFETQAAFVDPVVESRAEHEIKVLGGMPSKAKTDLDAAFVHSTIKAMNSGFTADKDAKEHMAVKVQNFANVLIHSVRKQYPKQKTLKETMVTKVLQKSLLA